MLDEQLRNFEKELVGFKADKKIPPLFLEPETGRWQNRFQIYVDGFWVRMQETLERSFPLFVKLVGPELWAEIGQNFIYECSRPHRNLNCIGSAFSGFLKQKSVDPVLVDIAHFEWSVIESFDSPRDVRDRSVSHQLSFDPGFRLFKQNHSIAKAWSERARSPELVEGLEYSMIYRDPSKKNVFVKIIDEAFYGLLGGAGEKLFTEPQYKDERQFLSDLGVLIKVN